MRLTLTLFLMLLAQMVWGAEIQAQTPEPACPSVRVEYKLHNPPGLVIPSACPGSFVTLNAVVTGFDQKEKPAFEWTISTGKIVEGQGTSTIKVLTDENTSEVKATVDIRRDSTVDPNCSLTASAIVRVASDCDPPCPSLSMTCPTGMMRPGEPVTFSVDISGAPPDLNLKYVWQVSAGKITGGQGTPAITVDTTGARGQSVTATVEIDGMQPECESLRSCTLGSGHPPPPARKYTEYGDTNWVSEEMRLAGFAIQLENEPGSQAYVIVYGARRAQQHLMRIRKFLIEKRALDPERLSLIKGGHNKKTKVELWLVPPGATAPKPDPNF